MKQQCRKVFSAGLLALALAGCVQVNTTSSGVVGINRSQSMLLTAAEVEQSSAKSYAGQLSQARGAGKLNTDPALTTRVRKVTQRLIAQAPTFRPDAAHWKWEVNVAETPELNAYAMAGGKIMVYSGLVKKLQLSDDEMAAVLGHEMAHALREHSREMLSQAYAQQMGLSLVGTLAGFNQSQLNLAGMAADVALSKPHSRTMESEADIIGLELMARAGYNPNAAVNVWNKMMRAGSGNGPEFLSTHPSGPTRIQDLQAHIPQVMPLYLQTKRG
ncbi:MAG: M48 family metallopeptidase [Aquitalea sp.]|nr:M48 family metallopeptidase [Aquitalea sp.]